MLTWACFASSLTRSPCWWRNFSLGVNLLCRIAGEVATALGEGFDIEVVEAHHNRKVDAPSGTALGLARAIAGALDRDVAKDLRGGAQSGQVAGEKGGGWYTMDDVLFGGRASV
ncbi:hypothetical protein FNF29_08389 [Cafeteria roenbergensis]|uniref:Dihydrodipicolinate reductase C-terminal domain-containing protein n=1 Tax=Cafeteria roenbergensis TaxID=33653 RepID=A0A5A8BYT3_CAFRO|nr:hypothetical protein FNF29_08389 [Cafeteria roenbergensis]|eukprot:KAA0145798.1 hypothetical protein FNF29_08389 [Cafeteria roenbergensis]